MVNSSELKLMHSSTSRCKDLKYLFMVKHGISFMLNSTSLQAMTFSILQEHRSMSESSLILEDSLT